MWFLPDGQPSCTNGPRMLESVTPEQPTDVRRRLQRKMRPARDADRGLLHRIGERLRQMSGDARQREPYSNVSIHARCCNLASHWKT